MSLWVDKYQPKSFKDLTFHDSLTSQLKHLANDDDLPNLLVYGPSGSGKKTRVNCLLKEIYGEGVEKVRLENREFVLSGSRKVELSVMSSNYHIEVNPSEVGNQDRVIIQTLIKEFAETQQVDFISEKKFKLVVITEADLLSRPAQQALRRTMEKYTSNLRMIMIATSTCNLLAPIRSRCLLMRVPLPTSHEIGNVLLKISEIQRFNLPQPLVLKIALNSKYNLRKSILLLEGLVSTKNGDLSEDADLPIPDWELYLDHLIQKLLSEQSPQQLYQCRIMLYELLSRCIPATIILKGIVIRLIEKCDSSLQPKLVKKAAEVDVSMKAGSKPILHMEAFLAYYMSIHKK